MLKFGLPVAILLLLLTQGIASAAPQLFPQASGERKFNEKPLWTMWTTGFSEQSAMAYARRVAADTGLADTMSRQLKRGLEREKEKPVTRPVKGNMMFMVVGLPPGVETLEFVEILEGQTFEKIVEQRRQQTGGNSATIEGAGDLISIHNSYSYIEAVSKTVEKDGKPVTVVERVERKREFKRYLRQHDGVCFEAAFPELHDMKLPDKAALGLGRRRRDEDLYFHADLTVVPRGIKDVFHKIIANEANQMLQQRDTEQLAPYEFRKAASKLVMELLRAGTFDVNQASGYIKFATETQPVRARFDVKVRTGSALSRQLVQVAKGRTRLPVDENAVLSVRSTWSMPPAFKALLAKSGPYLKSLAEEEKDAYAKAGLQYVAYALEKTGERGQFETAIQFGGNAASGPVLYGAVRVEQPDELVAGMEALMLTSILRSKGTGLPQISNEEHGERKYVRITAKDLDWPIEMKPECMFLAAGDGAVWFAIGGEDAWGILPDAIDGKNRQRARALLFDLKLNLDRFLTADDPAGLDKFARELDVQFDRMIPAPVRLSNVTIPEPPELLETVLQNAGRSLRLSLDPTPTGFAASATVDEGIARYATARLLSAQNRVMLAFEEEQKKRMEAARMEAIERKKAANAASKEAKELRKAVEKAEKLTEKADKAAGKARKEQVKTDEEPP